MQWTRSRHGRDLERTVCKIRNTCTIKRHEASRITCDHRVSQSASHLTNHTTIAYHITTTLQQFHKQWDFIIKRGRRAANAGRFFRDEKGKGPLTIEAELEGWAAYQEDKARATDAGRGGWEPLPNTVGQTIPRWVVETGWGLPPRAASLGSINSNQRLLTARAHTLSGLRCWRSRREFRVVNDCSRI
eukprot:COSAG02_NODE_631_length_19290_cov_67.062842_10_plen_188_part_00